MHEAHRTVSVWSSVAKMVNGCGNIMPSGLTRRLGSSVKRVGGATGGKVGASSAPEQKGPLQGRFVGAPGWTPLASDDDVGSEKLSLCAEWVPIMT